MKNNNYNMLHAVRRTNILRLCTGSKNFINIKQVLMKKTCRFVSRSLFADPLGDANFFRVH